MNIQLDNLNRCSVSGNNTSESFPVWLSNPPNATPLLPCSRVERTLPVALTYSPKLPLYHKYRKSTLDLRRKRHKSNSYIHTQVCIEKTKINFKSQGSVTKHILPLIKQTYYTKRVVLTQLQNFLITAGSFVGRVKLP